MIIPKGESMEIKFNAETTLKLSAGEIHLLLDIARMAGDEARSLFACGRLTEERTKEIQGLCARITLGLEASP